MIGEIIRRLRKENKLSQQELADLMGYNDRSTIAKIESGKVDISQTSVMKFSKIFNVSPLFILGLTEEPEIKAKRIPVYGKVAAGIPIEAITDILDYEEIPTTWTGEYIALKVVGDSMYPKISHGDVVIVRIQSDAENGDFVVAQIGENDATIKKLVKKNGIITLQPFNPAYEPLFFSEQEQETIPVKIIGKVVEIRVKL